MTEMVELKNIAKPRRMLVLNLDKNVANVAVSSTVTIENSQGERRQKVVRAMVPDSLRIPAGHVVQVSKNIAECLEVQRAKTRRDLKISTVKMPTQEKKAKRGRKR